MRRALLLGAALAVFLSAGIAGAAPAPIVVTSGPVTALAAGGAQLAFGAAGTGGAACDRVFIWQNGARFQLGRKRGCPSVHGVDAVSVSGNRALWLAWNGGKIREWGLWTAATTARTPRRLEFASQDLRVEDTQPIVLGAAGGRLLPYAVDSTVTVLNANGTKAFTRTAPARVVALAASGGRVAVADEGSRVTVLDAQGKKISVDLFVGNVSAVAFAMKGLLVQRGVVLELRRGADAREIVTAADARFLGASGKRAVWSDDKRVHVIRLPDGAQTAVFNGSHAALAGKRLYVSNGRRITLRTIR